MARLTFEFTGNIFDWAKAHQNLDYARDIVRPAFELMEEDFEEEMKRIWAVNKWPPNALKYLSTRKRSGKDNIRSSSTKPGVRTGKVRNAFTNRNAPGAVRRITDDTLELGVNIDYAKYSSRSKVKGGRRRVPERDPLLAIVDKNNLLKNEIADRWGEILRAQFIEFILNPTGVTGTTKRRK